MRVVKIIFGFDSDTLFGAFDTRRLDVEACANKFARLCENALKNAYPDAEIEISYKYSSETDDLISNSTPNQVNGQTDSEEIGNIEFICEQIRQESRWMVQRDWLTIWDAYSRSQIPPVFIQWMCNHKLIRGATKERGSWQFTHESLMNVTAGLKYKYQSHDILCANSSNHNGYTVDFHSATLLQTQIHDLPLSNSVLIIQLRQSLTPSFTENNTSFSVSLEQNQLSIQVDHFFDIETWIDSRWSYDAYTRTIIEQAKLRGIDSEYNESSSSAAERIDSMWLRFVHVYTEDSTLEDLLVHTKSIMIEIIQDADLSLSGGPVWRQDYEHNEKLFCLEVLEPLLNKMDFVDVRYRGGSKEYGKDFTFSEPTRFGEYRHYGLQAKDGDMSGRVNSVIDEIIGQLNDAFSMSFKERESDDERFVSHFIVAISGFYKENAQEKIRQKIKQQGRVGAVYFWDQNKIRELIRKAWLSK